MINITVAYNDDSQIELLKSFPDIQFLDERTRTGKKKAWSLKSHWGAKMCPFAIVMKGDKPIRAFYSESENVTDSLFNYLSNEKEI